jgi:cell wall-associated NlpC family hydrolase
MTKAERFLQLAISYENTPFLDHGREPGKWLDCAGIVVCALQEMDTPCSDFDYKLDAFNDHFADMIASLKVSFVQVETEVFLPGDVLAIRIPRIPAHLGVAIDNNYLVHATKPKGVRKAAIDYSIRNRVVSVWRLPDAGDEA